MKVNKAIFLITVLPALSHAELAEPTFSYSHITGTLSQVTVGDDEFEDITGYEYAVGISREFNPGAYLSISYVRSSIDDTVAFTGGVEADVTFDAGGNSFSVVGGKAVGLSDTVDVYGEIGFGFSNYELDTEIMIDGTVAASSSESENDTGIAAGVGLRIALDDSKRVELNPELSIASSSGETSKTAGLTLAIGLSDNVQVGVGVSLDLEDDISQVGGGIRVYY